MKSATWLPLVAIMVLPAGAQAASFSSDAFIDEVERTWEMGWTCLDSSHQGLMTRECGHFITAAENDYWEAQADFRAEAERIGHLIYRHFSGRELDELQLMTREITEMYVYADRLRKAALADSP